MKFFPSKKQWKNWSLPSKLTAIGSYLAIISLAIYITEFAYSKFIKVDTSPASYESRAPLKYTYYSISEINKIIDFFDKTEKNNFIFKNNVYKNIQHIEKKYLNRDEGWQKRELVQILFGVGYDKIINDFEKSNEFHLLNYHRKSNKNDYEYKSTIFGLLDYANIEKYIKYQDFSEVDFSSRVIKPFDNKNDSLGYSLSKKNPSVNDIFFVFSEFTNQDICDYSSEFYGDQKKNDGRYKRAVTPISESSGIFILSRLLTLDLVEIKNISDDNVYIKDIITKDGGNDLLEMYKENDVLESLSKSNKIPFKVLNPGDSILIPTNIYLGGYIGQGYLFFTLDEIYENQSKSVKNLTAGCSISYLYPGFLNDDFNKIPTSKSNQDIQVVDTFESGKDGEIININLITNNYENTFIHKKGMLEEIISPKLFFGSYSKPLSIKYSFSDFNAPHHEISETIRPADFKSLISNMQFEVGTCPFVYTFNKDENKWVFDSKFIVSNTSKDKKSWDYIQLENFTGEILITEEEDEISYIDYISIIIIYKNGSKIEILPKNLLLNSMDSKNLILEKGDKSIIKFEDYNDTEEIESVIMKVNGYYIELSSE